MATHAHLPAMTRRARTFFGCLTCRKRKVKCDSQQALLAHSSCRNCSRLNIPCTPSFHSNFKNSSLDPGLFQEDAGGNPRSDAQRGHSIVRPISNGQKAQSSAIRRKGQRKQRTLNLRAEPLSSDRGNRGVTESADISDTPSMLLSASDTTSETAGDSTFDVQNELYDRSYIPQASDTPSWPVVQAPNIFSYNIEDVVNDLAYQQWQRDSPLSAFLADPAAQSRIMGTGSAQISGGRAFELEMSSWRTPADVNTTQWGDRYLCSNTDEISCVNNPTTMYVEETSWDTLRDSHNARAHSNTTMLSPEGQRITDWSIPPQVFQGYHGNDVALINHFESTMSTFFSVKSPQWNLYTYMLRSSQGTTNSPLRHSILAWTSLHLSRRDKNPLENAVKYYSQASNGVNELLKELSTMPQRISPSSESSSTAEKLYMVLSTTFFLSHCNFMICDRRAFSERLNALKVVLGRHWESLRGELGSLSSRLLIWLAYLDLRASLWGDLSPIERLGDTQKRRPVLIDMLRELEAFPTLRTVSENQSYLSECFGENYPTSELRDDLVQEPVNATSDDIMCILSRVKAFEAWNDEMVRRDAYREDSAARELKETQVQSLRADIASIRAECNLAFPDPSSNKLDVDRTSFHCLTVSSLHHSATILLNRVLEPNVRTDEESQSAAHAICKIAHQLRRTGCLRTPRSLIWPLPIFIAGIETTDVIYQDWILEYIGEMEDWGPNMKSMGLLLRKILIRQERENRRVKVRDVIEDFDLGIIF